MARRSRQTKLPALYLKPISLRPDALPTVTIFCGEDGDGKSTLIEALAAVCGFSDSGGNRSVAAAPNADHGEMNGAALGHTLRGSWLQ